MALRHDALGKISESGLLPNSVRAVLGHYGRGEMSLAEGKNAIELNLHIEDRKEDFMQELFDEVAAEIGERSGEEDVDFSYDTKLTFPVELTLGKIYEEAQENLPADYDVLDGEAGTFLERRFASDEKLRKRRERIEKEYEAEILRVREGEVFTDLVMGLLVEGDMRDAIQDDEYGDFETNASIEDEEVAEIAQRTLLEELQPGIEEYPEGVRDAYEKAFDLSMSHQKKDKEFRRMFKDARENPEDAEEIIRPYRDGETESRFSLDWSEVNMPFFASQYERVGVLYDSMFEGYEEAGFPIDDDFRRSMVLSTIGAQIWLDDVDDLEEDWKNGQLTPVTAEVLTSETGEEAYENIVTMKDEYLDAAREYAVKSDSDLASIGIEYIDKRGEQLDLKGEIEKIK
jgi:hypothetical protein